MRLFMLTVVGNSDRTIHYCKTVAASLDDAESVLHGGGEFIPSANDALLTPEQLRSITS